MKKNQNYLCKQKEFLKISTLTLSIQLNLS